MFRQMKKPPCSCWLACHLGSEPTWRWWWGSRALHRWCLVVCRSAGSQLVGSLAMTSTLQNPCNFPHDFIFIEMVSCSMSRVWVTQSCKGSSPKTFENMWDDQLIQSCADGFMFFLSTVIRGFQEDLYWSHGAISIFYDIYKWVFQLSMFFLLHRFVDRFRAWCRLNTKHVISTGGSAQLYDTTKSL